MREATKSIKPASQALRHQAKRRWDQVAKPLGSLGILREGIMRIAVASGNLAVNLYPRAIVIMCGDNGIVKGGVTQAGREVTAIAAGDMAQENSYVCLMARQTGADIIPMDVSVACRDAVPDVVNRRVAYGTRDFLEVSAMTRRETVKVMEAGANITMELKERDYVLASSREMGIDDTTTSSTLLSVLLDMNSERVTDRGAGLTAAGYNHKIQVMREGIRTHRSSGENPVDTLSKVSDLGLVAPTGLYIGCTTCGLPMVLDGLIVGTAALAAIRISPNVKEHLLVSRVSAKPTGAMVLDALGLRPTILAGVCLGEGAGAAILFPLLDMAASVYTQMSSLGEIRVGAYKYLV